MPLLDALLLGFAAGALWLVARCVVTRAYVRVNPRYQRILDRLGLSSPRDFLRLPAVITSGHPDRNVARVTLGTEDDAIYAYLKREHRVRWKQRLANFWAGYGPVSVSQREALTLRRLRRAGIGCPEWIAVGADDQGRAFLVVEELSDCNDLRCFLADWNLSAPEQRRFACHLGKTLARLHDAGFSHPDLYAKHLLIHPDDWRISILDWQRSRRRHSVSLEEGWHDLAALDATLADDLAHPRERLVCLRAYLVSRLAASLGRARTARLSALARGSRINGRALLRRALAAIRIHRKRLLQRRHIHEARRIPDVKQDLLWLDEDALCVTPEYHRRHDGVLPVAAAPARNEAVSALVPLPGGGQGLIIKRRIDRFGAWLAAKCGRPLATPEVRQAGLLFRLQRCGVHTAQLLAFGQRHVSPFRIESFLLTEPPAGARSLTEWLTPNATPRGQRWTLMREFGRVIQRLHAAGCCLLDRLPGEGKGVPLFSVNNEGASNPHVILTRIDGVCLNRRSRDAAAVRDFLNLRRGLNTAGLSRTDELRVILAYLGQKRLTADGKCFVRRVDSLHRKEARA